MDYRNYFWDYIGTTIGIHSPIPYWCRVSGFGFGLGFKVVPSAIVSGLGFWVRILDLGFVGSGCRASGYGHGFAHCCII